MKYYAILLYFLSTSFCCSDPTPSIKDVNLNIGYGHDTMQTTSNPDIVSFSKIPNKLQLALTGHLTKRVGVNASKLEFRALWKINDKRLLKKAYGKDADLEKRFIYHIEFKVNVEGIGLDGLRVFIRFGDDFRLFEDIELPSKEGNWNFIHLKEVFDKGVEKTKKSKFYSVDFVYNKRSDKMEWVVESNSSNMGTIETHQAFFDAVSGDFLRFGNTTADGF